MQPIRKSQGWSRSLQHWSWKSTRFMNRIPFCEQTSWLFTASLTNLCWGRRSQRKLLISFVTNSLECPNPSRISPRMVWIKWERRSWLCVLSWQHRKWRKTNFKMNWLCWEPKTLTLCLCLLRKKISHRLRKYPYSKWKISKRRLMSCMASSRRQKTI